MITKLIGAGVIADGIISAVLMRKKKSHARIDHVPRAFRILVGTLLVIL